jgi:hypothetical protein
MAVIRQLCYEIAKVLERYGRYMDKRKLNQGRSIKGSSRQKINEKWYQRTNRKRRSNSNCH